MLSSRHLIFMEMARLSSFTKASQTLLLSQSAISKHIKSLEYFYKTGLFERHGTSISLTQAGPNQYVGLYAVYDRRRAGSLFGKDPLHDRTLTVADLPTVPLALRETLMLNVLRESGGTAIAVSENDMLEGVSELCHHEGIFAAPEGGAI